MTTETTSNASPVDAPNGHDQAMAEKFDAAQAKSGQHEQPTTPKAERPAGLPEKFASWEDMAKAYSELEKKQGQTTTTPEVPANAQDAQAQVEALGLDFNAFSAEYAANGELSQATYDALAKAGVPKEIVDAYVAGQEAQAAQMIESVQSEFGGPEAYGQMVNWAAANMSKAEVTAFNKVMDGGDLGSIKLAISGLQARFKSAVGDEPNLLNGGNGNTDVDAFRSTAEITSAMSDPRYAKDPAYRAEVQAKIGRSNVF